MSSISRIHQADSPYTSSRWAKPVARVRTHAESTNSTLTLKVRTAEGDTVELSYDAASLKQHETGKAQSSQGKVAYTSDSQSDSFNFNVKIDGNLNDQELADIGKLIQSLKSGNSAAPSVSSLAAYSGAYKQTKSVTDNTVRLFA